MNLFERGIAMNKLEERIKELEQENAELRKKLLKYEPESSYPIQLNREEKLNIYMDYFQGRKDVIAIRFFHKAKQRFSYTPFCNNEFKDGYCLKKNGKFSCTSCPNRDFVPYTKELLLEHFLPKQLHYIYTNKDIYLGIYPLLKDNTCHLLAIDFDDGNWFQEILCVKRVAQKYNIDTVMERSQSGLGGHLWIFFKTPILAVKARKLGRFLLKDAMRIEKSLALTSFDRMFPNQDTILEDGFGNLIALPLQFDAYQMKNSVFIDNLERIIENQIAYLSMVNKLTEAEVDHILASEIAEDYFFDGNQIMLPLGPDLKYNSYIELVEDSMLHINKSILNANTLNLIRRMASMANPEYQIKMRLHKAIYQTPYILSEYVESEQMISIPRGCKDNLKSVFTNANISIKDHTNLGHEIPVSFKGSLQEQQQKAITACLQYDTGILHAPAGFGKTVMAIYMIAHLKRNTIIIVPTKDLLKQWMERLDMFLEYPKAKKKKDTFIGEFSGSKKNLKGDIDIATIQSLSKCEDIHDKLNDYGCVLIDECHHIPADSFRRVLRQIPAHYIYGFSATPQRQDGLEKILYMYCGAKCYEVDKKQIIAKRKFHQYLIPHFTNVKLLEKKENFQGIIDVLYTNEHRNFFIANDIISEFRKGRNCIVLSERIEHLQLLYEKIRDVSPNVFIFQSNMKTSDRKKQMKAVKDFDEAYIILATSKLLGEGFDLPSLNTLFLTLPISDKNRIAQYTGRIHRNFEGKENVYVHDYVDIHIPMMESMFKKRMRAYETEGYITNLEEAKQEMMQYVFDLTTYLPYIQKDVQVAKKEILIVMKQYTLTKIKQHHKLLQNSSMRSVSVTFVLPEDSPADSESIKYMMGCGANIIKIKHKRRLNMIIIDQKQIWYGDLNMFGRNHSDASLIRLENKMLIEEMLNELEVIDTNVLTADEL